MPDNIKTVFIVDDNKDFCDAMRWLCESVNLHVKTYLSAKDFLDTYAPNLSGCLIVDVRMPVMNGLELIEAINLKINQLFVVVISGFSDISMAVKAMRMGAVDFILKPFNNQMILETIQNCLAKDKISPDLIAITERINQLTKREREILNLILDGKLNKEISYKLSIGMSTVEAHRSRIMHKMNARNVTNLIKSCLHLEYGNKIQGLLIPHEINQ